MATYQLNHTGQEIDAAVDWVKNSQSTVEDQIHQNGLGITLLEADIGTINNQLENHSALLTKHGNALNGLSGLNNLQTYDLKTPELLNSSGQADQPSIRFWKSGHFVYVEINGYYNTNTSAVGGTVNFQAKLPPQLIPVWNVFMLNAAQNITNAAIHETIYFDEQGNISGQGFTQASGAIWCTAMYLTANLIPLQDENGTFITGDTYDKWFETHPL